jgi:hypothetical protein
MTSDNRKSEYCSMCTVKTTSKNTSHFYLDFLKINLFIEEPITGEALHRAIVLDRKGDIEKILESPDGRRVLEIPDKYGNYPLMAAVNRNNLE